MIIFLAVLIVGAVIPVRLLAVSLLGRSYIDLEFFSLIGG